MIADLRNSVKERDSADVECAASEREERVFALLKDLKLPDSDGKAKAGQLFKTTLAKSLLSSPMAALETVRNRLKRLEAGASSSDSPASADRAALQSLEPLLAAITPADFSKYQRLLQLIRDDWAWSGKDPTDRIVLFTGRRETQRFLVEHLAADLGLPQGAVVGLDGAMPDRDLTDRVEDFAQEKEAVRILVATEVASEGLNLHYLSHRLVHVDIPWSLMTLQQRNGRIDRYGQPRQPLICYLLNASRSEGMGDAEKVVRLLREKDKQAQLNIGDPAVFLGVYDAAAEEELISRAYEAGTLKDLDDRMEANAEPQRQASSGDQLFEELFGISADTAEGGGNGSGDGSGGGSGYSPAPAGNPTPVVAQTRQSFSLFPSLWGYVDTALDAVAQQMERRGENSICASSPSSNGWRSRRLLICSAATTAIPASCSRPAASAWRSPPSRRPCSGPWSRAGARTTADQNWNTSGICTRWWIGWPTGDRSPSRAITRRCYSSPMASIRARW